MAERKGITILFFLLLALVVLFLRLPGLSDCLCNPDQGTPAYTARLLLEGRCPYSEAVISKPPGTVVLFALLFELFGVNLIFVHGLAAVWIFASALALFVIGRRHGGLGTGMLSAAIFAMAQADLYSAGICPNFEFWAILPAVGCLALLPWESSAGPFRAALMGALACLALFMKQTALFFVVAGALLLVERSLRTSEKGWRGAGAALVWFGGGLGAVFILFAGVMLLSSCLIPMLDVLNPFKLKTYVASYDAGARWDTALLELSRFWRSNRFLTLLAGASLLLLPFSRRLQLSLHRFSFAACFCFLLAAAFMAGAGGHFFDHYFVVLLPFMSLMVGMAFGDLARRHGRFARLGIVIFCVVMALILVDSRHEIRLAAVSLGNRLQTGGNGLDETVYEDNNENRYGHGYAVNLIEDLEWQPLYVQAAEFMKERLGPGESIWVYDYMPEQYHYTQRFAPTRHQENFEIVYQSTNPNYGLWHDRASSHIEENRRELMTDLAKSPPRFIVLYRYDCPWEVTSAHYRLPEWPRNVHGASVGNCKAKQALFPELESFLKNRYRQVDPPVNNSIDLYELID